VLTVALWLLVNGDQHFATAASNLTVSVPYEYTYRLPSGFSSNANETFVNSTTTGNDTIDSLLDAASKAPYIAYDDSFYDIIGRNASEPQLVQQRDSAFAYEAGVWVPERDEVWFTSDVSDGPRVTPHVSVLNLSTNAVYPLNGTSQPIVDGNGGYYFQGKVYFATYPDNTTYRGGIISVDARTLEVETVLNSYFGLSFNGVDDIAWAQQGNDRYMYFTDLAFPYLAYPTGLPPVQLPATVWRWDPQDGVLLPVISRNEVNPNGVRVSPDFRTLYVTDDTATFGPPGPNSPPMGPGAEDWLGPYVYKYDLDSEMMPVNRRVFALVRQGKADGIHVDDAGNVWTGEYEGVTVRNPKGKVIGQFNSQYFQENKNADGPFIANFALAGDTFVFLSTTRLWTVKLAKTVVGAGSSIVN